jgi:type II secretory pathway pseudopilin PulG
VLRLVGLAAAFLVSRLLSLSLRRAITRNESHAANESHALT